MPGLSSVLDIGRWALFTSQSAIETAGNNIANVNTPGYSRRKVIIEEAPSIDFSPGQLGRGVRAKEIVREFDDFIEKQYLNKYADEERWKSLHENLDSVQTVFKNEEGRGLSAALEKFWSAWQDLAQRPDDGSVRTALLGSTQNLLQTINIASTDLRRLQTQVNDFIQQDVDKANKLIEEISDINRQIIAHEIPGKNIPNELYDKRNKLMRELAQLMDINVMDHGGGNLLITTRAGHTLVDGVEHYRIAFESPQTFTTLSANSNFDGQIYFDGSDDYEYTFEVVQAGPVTDSKNSSPPPAELKISIDGGKTWLKDEDGNLITIPALDYNAKVHVPNSNIDIWFGDPNDPSTYSGSNDLQVGDRFEVIPKHGLYWYKTSSSKVNITPMILGNGTDNSRRLVGGTLTGEFNFRDNYVGEIREKFNEFARELVWEVNQRHSQGAGLKKFAEVTGTYTTTNTSVPLGSESSGLAFYDKLQKGNVEFYIYNKETDELITGPLTLDMDGTYADNVKSPFDPSTDSLEDIRDAINNDPRINTYLQASIIDGKLHLEAKSGYRVAFGTDSSGLLAALGINTFFEGTSAENIAINPVVNNNLDFINAGKVNGSGETNPGDNTTANSIAKLQYTQVEFTTKTEGTTHDTLQNYYNSLTAQVGAYTQRADYNQKFFESLTKDLDERQKEISGVNLDEEMSNLLKFQQAYTAAAKLITVSEQMMNTVLQMFVG